jgi:hypothetical protein
MEADAEVGIEEELSVSLVGESKEVGRKEHL